METESRPEASQNGNNDDHDEGVEVPPDFPDDQINAPCGEGRVCPVDADDFLMPDGIEDLIDQRNADYSARAREERRAYEEEEQDELEQAAKAKRSNAGRIKKGERRNPNGRRGSARPSHSVELPPALLVGKILQEKQPVRVGGKTISITRHEIMLRQILSDFPNMEAHNKIRTLAYLERTGGLSAFQQLEEHLAERERREAEARSRENREAIAMLDEQIKLINETLGEDGKYEGLDEYIRRTNPEACDRYLRERLPFDEVPREPSVNRTNF